MIEINNHHRGHSFNINSNKVAVYYSYCDIVLPPFTMAGRNSGHGGCGRVCNNGRGGGACSHGCFYNNQSKKSIKVGLFKDLEGNILDFGTKTSADLMRTSQEKIVQYIATK